MSRPVRPVALVLLTACMLYPGLTLTFQGFYPFFNGEWFNLVGNIGPWHTLALSAGLPLAAVSLVQGLLGLAWVAGVLGLWAGDGRAYPLTLLAAAGTLLLPVGPTVMSALGLVALLFFREDAESVPA